MQYFLIILSLFLGFPSKAATPHPSVKQLWNEYQATLPSSKKSKLDVSPSWYFGDNQKDADELAALALSGKKQATSTLLWNFEYKKEPIPKKGNLYIITNWAGVAQCIIQVTKVEIVPFHQVTEAYTRIEGEGDGSLQYWRTAHLDYFPREAKSMGRIFTESAPVVLEQFRVVWPSPKP